MSEKRVVLITGIAGYWGGRVARRLLDEPDLQIVGLDNKPPEDEIVGLDFIRADIRNPLLVELLESEGVNTVCHLNFVESIERAERVFEANVMGTMKVLGACAQAGVKRVVLRSSTAVYGAHPNNSAFLTEDTPLQGSLKYGYTRDLVEIESFCSGFRGQSPETGLAILRFANIIGQTADSPLMKFLKLPSPPILLGFDPLLQLIHEDDVVEALAFAIIHDVGGAFNVGTEGTLPLSRILRLAGTVPMPIFHPLAYWGLDFFKGSRWQPYRFVPIEWDYLRYPWVSDLTKMVEIMGFSPVVMADEAVREFARGQNPGQKDRQAEDLANDESSLRDIMERRRRIRERQVSDEEKN
jgi:UDP-glucose 4-epimerase